MDRKGKPGVATPAHVRGINDLVADGWTKPGGRGFYKDIALAVASWSRGNWREVGPDACDELWKTIDAKYEPKCLRSNVVAHETDNDEIECLGCLARYYYDEFRGGPGAPLPDAWRITWEKHPGGSWPCIWVAEVNVTHHAELEKWAPWWDLIEDGHEIAFRYLVVDRNGVRSEPWSYRDAAKEVYGFDLFGAAERDLSAAVAQTTGGPRGPLSQVEIEELPADASASKPEENVQDTGRLSAVAIRAALQGRRSDAEPQR